MIIEITGVGTRNKGAELMLLAIQQHLNRCAGPIDLVVDPHSASYVDRARYGLQAKLPTGGRIGRSALATALMPASFRRAYGLVAENDIDVVLDASGFAFSDQFGPNRVERFAADARRWKRQGKRLVLLPQAFGPFNTLRTREAMASILESADLVFARESESLEHLHGIGSGNASIRLAPDFTNLLSGERSETFVTEPRSVCVVPNQRMLEKAESGMSQLYIPFLAECIRVVKARGYQPFVLLHDAASDEPLVQPLLAALDAPLPVVRESNPLRLKGILAQAEMVIGSRFHALVGALSQAVPCIGAGWSHKYEMLFQDYGCRECLLPVSAKPHQIREAVERICDRESRDGLLRTLEEAAREQKRRATDMWTEVDACLGIELADESHRTTNAAERVAYGSHVKASACFPQDVTYEVGN